MVVVGVSLMDSTRFCSGPTHSFALCVPHAERCGDDIVAHIVFESSSTTNQLKHCPLVSVAEGLNS